MSGPPMFSPKCNDNMYSILTMKINFKIIIFHTFILLNILKELSERNDIHFNRLIHTFFNLNLNLNKIFNNY
jgi:hypothetical protein